MVSARVFLFVAATLIVAGCTSTPRALLNNAPQHGIDEIASTPFFPQQTYQCGPAALATLINWVGEPVTPDQLTQQLYINERKGSLQVELVAATRRHGLLPYEHDGGLERLWALLENRTPVLVLQNLAFSWYPKWHYAVAVGFDADKNQVLLRSGRERLHRESLDDFARSWALADHWMVTVHQPGSVPPQAEPIKYLSAAQALEQTGQNEASIAAYRAATEQWSDSMLSWMALGNAHYQKGRFTEAETAYKQAAAAAPQHPAPVHNLAWALIKQNREAEAKFYATKAVSLGENVPAAQRAQYQSAIQAIQSE